jgi:hypothetical protein
MAHILAPLALPRVEVVVQDFVVRELLLGAAVEVVVAAAATPPLSVVVVAVGLRC